MISILVIFACLIMLCYLVVYLVCRYLYGMARRTHWQCLISGERVLLTVSSDCRKFSLVLRI
jgi:hypothetical protein